MARFPERFINQVQQATDIVDVVGQCVALTKRGKEFVGLCPFHQDHNPSMYVSPVKQIFKCFACGAGGGVFQFLMQLQKLSFPEAVRQLADQAGLPIPRTHRPARAEASGSTEPLLKAMTFAARFFRDRLNAPEGAAAKEYALGRRVSEESIGRFGIGYAPAGWETLCSAARRAGFSDRQLLAAGLAAQRDDGSCYDRFRNRLMFPILDPAGKVIAFGGRALSDEERAKYLNSPETVLFDKSANLYALNWAREGIVRSGQAVVVEGYLDAIMCLQEGLDNVVATLGTSLTERHVRLLGRFSREVVLVFDADTAGQAAAERAIQLFLSQRVHVRVAAVGEDAGTDGAPVKDPCDYVLTVGADAMRALLAEAPDAMEYAWRRRLAEYEQAGTLTDRRRIAEDFLALVVSAAAYGAIDPVRQGLLANHLGQLIGLSPSDVAEQMRRIARRVRGLGGAAEPAGAAGPGQAPVSPAVRSERWLLGALLNASELFDEITSDIDPSMFTSPALRSVAEQVWRLGAEGKLELSAVLGAGESDQWGRLVTDLQIDGERRGSHAETLAGAAEDFRRRRERDDIQSLKQQSTADNADLLRRIAQHARRPDPRRRPRV